MMETLKGKKIKNNKGITLIVLLLVITIILVILAGVVILMLSGKKKKTQATLPIVKDVSKITTPVEEKTIYEDTTKKQAIIPQGFKVSAITTEQKIDEGLVVIAPDGSEFVWVPVDDISTMCAKKSNGSYSRKII